MISSITRIFRLAAGGMLLASLFAVPGFGEGFGTPTMDGSLTGDEAIYNAPEGSDGVDPPQGNAPMDLGDLYVANDATYWYFLFTVNDDIGANNWGKYMLLIDTTNDANGGVTDPWGRNIQVNDPHKSEFQVRSWVDGGGAYSAGKTQFWAWTQAGSTWASPGPIAEAVLATGATSTFEWKIARTALGDPSTIWCEVSNTAGGGTDNAQDTINDPAQDWNATDWATTALLDNSTEVALSSGTDTTPPTVLDGCTNDPGDGFSDTVLITFSEPVDATTATNAANYSDLGGRTVFSPTLVGPNQVTVIVSPVYTFGTCQQIAVSGVKDLSDNEIVANGTTNVADFFAFQIFMMGNMALHMQADTTSPHTFGLEGSQLPLTWDPTCDFLLDDADADSVYTGTVNFCLPCVQGALRGLPATPSVTEVQYKFTHQCTEYEPMGDNHYYTIDPVTLGAGVDTLMINWNNEATGDFTAIDIDAVFTVQALPNAPSFGAGDSLGVGGSAVPLDWNNPPTSFMADDGTGPDVAAGDGIFSARVTFPAGTLKDVEFKYLLKANADTLFSFECAGGQPNRTIFLDDTMFSTANPIVLDLAHFDDCNWALDAPAIAVGESGYRLEPGRPNPTNDFSTISYVLPAPTAVRLDIFDVRGRLVRTLVDSVRPAGRNTIMWNGRTANGEQLPAGVYFSRLSAGEFTQSRKIVLMR
ncbi:T9SS type A sorting domain-containing protein [bacterium]|nr:T9SS type A sorting domain-containing protein [bacterium]